MTLYFTDKKRRWPPSKPAQYIAACALLLIGLIVLGAWLFIRFIYTEPTPADTTPNPSIIDINELPDPSYCLIVVEDHQHERFALVKSAPKDGVISVTALSPMMETNDGYLYSLLQKHGPARTAQTVAKQLDLPALHYMAFSIEDVEILFTRLGESLQFTVPEEVTYTDENGATIRLNAESHKLTPTQIASLLRYTKWENNDHEYGLAADITAAVMNQCLRPNKSLKGYFELLSNTSATDLRIDQFNAYRNGIEYLATINAGAVAKRDDTLVP